MDAVQIVYNTQHNGEKVFDNTGPQWHTTCVPTIMNGGEVINQVRGFIFF